MDDSFGTVVSQLYSCLGQHPLKNNITISPLMSTTPFPHQIQAISWMCFQEGMIVDQEEEVRCQQRKNELHELFIPWPGDNTYYYSPYTQFFTKQFFGNILHRNGGVICDGMGLGKTYEIISLFLLHPRCVMEYERKSIKRESNRGAIDGIDWRSYLKSLFETKEFIVKTPKLGTFDINTAIHPDFVHCIPKFSPSYIAQR